MAHDGFLSSLSSGMAAYPVWRRWRRLCPIRSRNKYGLDGLPLLRMEERPAAAHAADAQAVAPAGGIRVRATMLGSSDWQVKDCDDVILAPGERGNGERSGAGREK